MQKSHAFRLVCCLVIVAAVYGGEIKRIKLKRGGELVGTVVEVDGKYEITSERFGVVTIEKTRVALIEDYTTPQQEYQKRLAKIALKSPQDRVELGKWAMEQKLWESAKEQFTEALQLKEDYERASLLLRYVNGKIAASQKATKNPSVRPATGPLVASATFDPKWLVTEAEINRIRMSELRPEDRRVRVKFLNKLEDRFIDQMLGKGDFSQPNFATKFRRMKPAAKAMYILDNLDRVDPEMVNDIVIASDPQFMIEFRQRVWPILSSFCARIECHGGEKPLGRLRLFKKPGSAAEYTNFLILDYYESKGMKMIDRDHRDTSLLLQYGLPRDLAKYPHPVPLRRTPFQNRQSVNYRRVRQWVDSLMGPPEPDYDVKLRLPWAPKSVRVVLPDLPDSDTQPAEDTSLSPDLGPKDPTD